ncbi:MAG: phosphoserine phosphatase SerB [Candidatus Hydrogenedentota bacterium]|nr:MAG: phosphoserine phosphatase SerB [Candidatus Hydrogenedentota bacterium]
MQKRNVLVHITGPDHPGILAGVLGLLSKRKVELRDLQQTTSLGQLSLSLLLCIPDECGLSVIKDLTGLTRRQKLHADFFVLDEAEVWPNAENEVRYVLTFIAEKFDTSAFEALSRAIADKGINIVNMTRLADGDLQCLEMFLSAPASSELDLASIKSDLFQVAFREGFDLAIQPEDIYRRAKRLVVMDMDSTLIQQEVIDEIAHFAGVKEKVAFITERAMRGEIDFDDALKERVSLLKGIKLSALKGVLSRISLTPGAERFIAILKKLGYKTAVISGGFTFFTEYFQKKLGLDYHFANTLESDGEALTGRVVGKIVNRRTKAELLKEIAQKEGIPLEQTVAVGDGANDLEMLEVAGLGVAFNAKPAVRKQAGGFISQPNLDVILYLLGVSQRDLKRIKES